MTRINPLCLVLICVFALFGGGSGHYGASAHVIKKRFAVDTSHSLLDDTLDDENSNEFFDDEEDGFEKRGSRGSSRYDDFMDYTNTLKRFSLAGTDLGKRAFRADLGKRAFRADLGKRSETPPLSNAAELIEDLETIKRLSNGGNSGFRSDLGKRAEYVMPDLEDQMYGAFMDDTDNMDSSVFDKRAFRMDLGKRAFRADLGKRAFRADLGKRAFRADLGKRSFDDVSIEDYISKRPSYRIDLGKRAGFRSDLGKRAPFRMDLGKRAAFRMDLGKRAFRSDLGKRDTELAELSLAE